MKTENIHQEIIIKANPSEVYNALMDSDIHSKFTGDIAEIGKTVGEKCSAFDGYATGENLKLEPNKLIVQSWRASDWPEGHYSTVEFNLKLHKEGTKLTFKQTDVPEEFVKDISDGWKEYYWKPLNEMLKKG